MKSGAIFKFFLSIFFIAIALGIAVFLFRTKPKAERQEREKVLPYVEVMSVKNANETMFIEGYGTIRPIDSRKIVAEVRGQLVMISTNLNEGGFFKKGEILLKIDPRSYELELQRQAIQIRQFNAELKSLDQEARNLEESIKISQSAVKLALAEHKRLKKLAKNNVTTQTNLDKAEQQYLNNLDRLQGLKNQTALIGPQRERLQAQQAMVRVALNQAKLDLEKTNIPAPFDGWVLEKTVEIGEYVNTGQVLGTIYEDGELEVEVNISLKEMKWFSDDISRVNMPEAEIIMNNGEAVIRWEGQVTRFKASMDEKTRTLPVVVEIKKAQAVRIKWSLLGPRPGMFVNVKIKGAVSDKVFVLPRNVVHEGDLVYIADENKLRIRKVRVLRKYKDYVYIDSGLTSEDLIIKTPLTYATEGMLIRTN